MNASIKRWTWGGRGSGVPVCCLGMLAQIELWRPSSALQSQTQAGIPAGKDNAHHGLDGGYVALKTCALLSGENIRELARGRLLLVQNYRIFLMPGDQAPEMGQSFFCLFYKLYPYEQLMLPVCSSMRQNQ